MRDASISVVFTFVDVRSLLFSCKISLCVRDGDGCEGVSVSARWRANGDGYDDAQRDSRVAAA